MLANKYIAAIATAIAAIISLSPVKAQTDTPGYIPLFDNLQSTDGQGMQKEYNNQLKIAVPQSYEDVDPEETDDALQSLYNAGKLAEAYEFVEKSKSKYRRLSESSKYLKYLIATTKELGYDEKADSLTIQFYHKYPFYKNKATDPPSFVELRSNFYAKPMFAFRASASHVLPRIMIDTIYDLYQTRQKPTYTDITCGLFDLGIEYYPYKQWMVSVLVSYQKLSYTRDNNNKDLPVKYQETSKYWGIPISIGYMIPLFKENGELDFMAGVSPCWKTNTEYTTTFTKVGYYTDDEIVDYIHTYQITDKKLYTKIFAGARISYKIRRYSLFVEAKYAQTLNTIDNINTHHKELLYLNCKFAPDAIRIAEIDLSIGIKINFWYKTFAKYGYGY